jgi:hypothetical protein
VFVWGKRVCHGLLCVNCREGADVEDGWGIGKADRAQSETRSEDFMSRHGLEGREYRFVLLGFTIVCGFGYV